MPRVSTEHVLGSLLLLPLLFRALSACPLAPCPGRGAATRPQDTPAMPTPVRVPPPALPCVLPSLVYSSP